MRIGIDISQLVYDTGVSVYTRNLINHLLKIDKGNEYLLIGGSIRRRNVLSSFVKPIISARVRSKIIPVSPLISDILWNRINILPIEIISGKLDVFHSSDWSQPRSCAFLVTTVHDLSPLRFPQFADSKIVDVHTRRINLVKKYVDRVIVPSKATRKDLVLYGISAKRIRVIPEANSPAFKVESKKKIRRYLRILGIEKEFLLSVGVSPRKNTERIIEAFRKIRRDRKNLSLILVGNPVAIDVPKEKDIILLGNINNSLMSILYSGAKALVYPSLYEGFGLPILDAMACKTPVVTSNISSMPEVGGEAVAYVDPFKVDSIVEGILKALRDRDYLIRKGNKRFKMFSWEKTAEKTLEVYYEYKNK